MKPNSATRKEQLKIIFEAMSACPNAILMGDFNFCSTWKENSNIDPTYTDLWFQMFFFQ